MSEDIIWQILDEQFCSFKAKFEKKSFCTNEYNLTGMCNKMYCPLANGRYATVREEDGVLYLHIKTIERAHSPANLWEKIQLPDDIPGSLAIINQNLAYWPKRFVNKVKERLVRLHQYLIHYRKWYYKTKPRLVTVHKKFERREQRRELKSLVAAKLDTHILEELQDRYNQGLYDEVINSTDYKELLREHNRREYLKLRGRRNKGNNNQEKEEEGTKETESDTVSFNSSTQFVEADDDDIEDLEDTENVEEDEEDEEVEEVDAQLELEEEEEEEEGGIQLNLTEQEAQDPELQRYRRMLNQLRKRKLEQAKKTESKKKRTNTRYPRVEIEYEEEDRQTNTNRN